MKKLFGVSLAALLVLIMMVGCGKEVNNTPAITSDTTPEVSVEPTNALNSKSEADVRYALDTLNRIEEKK